MKITESQIEPRSKQIFVRVDDEESRENENGLITPSNVEQEKKAYGIVLKVGNDKDLADIKEGDRVVFGKYAGEDLQITDENSKATDYKLLFNEDVLAFIRGDLPF